KMRAAGYRSPLYVMSRGGGRQLTTLLNRGLEVQNADPLHNTVFGWQAYWGTNSSGGNYWANTANGMTLREAMIRVRDAPVPIQVGAIALADPNE
ncbi:hypothetical protein, partial [Bacillus subtilis]|uniref:hypothetical protein n=1 Tax=Bacillus subtilis TaxID=1423 RepID=UPI003C1AD095